MARAPFCSLFCSLFGALTLAAAAAASAENCPPQVRVGFPNFEIAPLLMGSDQIGNPPGLLVEWTRNALAAAGCTDTAVVLMRRPQLRQMAEVGLGLIDILPGFAFSPALSEHMVFPMRGDAPDPALMIKADAVSLYARAADQRVKWDGKTLVAPNQRIGVSTGVMASSATIKAHNWITELAANPRIDLQKLIAGRVDVILEADVVLEALLQGPEGRAVRRLSPPMLATSRYAPVRRGFAQQYPDYTRRFWRELCKQSRTTYRDLPACG